MSNDIPSEQSETAAELLDRRYFELGPVAFEAFIRMLDVVPSNPELLRLLSAKAPWES